MKKLYILLLLFIPDCIWGQVDLKTGLIACYPFSSSASDETGNGHSGTINGATLTTDRFGKANSAYNFDGTNYIELAKQSDFYNNEFTYAAWVEASSLPQINDANTIFSVTGGAQMLYIGNSVVTNNQPAWAEIAYTIEGLSSSPHPSYTTNVTTGSWHHIVCTQSKTQINLYLDGVLVRTSNFPSAITPAYTSTLRSAIGARDINGSYGQFFKGKIDDIHIYNRPLNADEVKTLFNNNLSLSITNNNAHPCGGDKITFTINGAYALSKYQWMVNDINAGSPTTASTFDYNSATTASNNKVKISAKVTNEDTCFLSETVLIETMLTINNCTCPTICVPIIINKTNVN